MSLLSRLANVFRGEPVIREIDEELASHLQEAAAHGRDPVESRRALGSSLRLREASHDIKLIPWLDGLRADTVFAWRQLNKRRVTSLAAILSLGLAIGASTAAFRLIDALFLRPLPIAHPERLYELSTGGLTYTQFRPMRAGVKEDAELIAFSRAPSLDAAYGANAEIEKANVQFVSGWMFGSFGLKPALGRLLTESDDLQPGAHPVAVLSFDYWTRRFARDPSIIGRTVRAQLQSHPDVRRCSAECRHRPEPPESGLERLRPMGRPAGGRGRQRVRIWSLNRRRTVNNLRVAPETVEIAAIAKPIPSDCPISSTQRRTTDLCRRASTAAIPSKSP